MVTAAWKQAATSATTEPAFLLSIYDGTNTFRCLSRSCSQLTDPVALTEVDSFDSGLDPLTRKTSIGECMIDVSAAWFRPIAINYRMVGKQITVKSGFEHLAESDFKGFFCGAITKNPEQIDAQTVRITASSVIDILAKAAVSGSWFNKHPLKILYAGDGTGIIEAAGVPASMVNTASFSPSAWPSIQNLCWNKAGNIGGGWYGHGVYRENALELAESLCEIIGGSLVVSGDGVISFALYDSARATADSWTSSDIFQGSFRIDPDEIVCNCVTLDAGYEDDNLSFKQSRTDTASMAALAYPGTTERVIEHVIDASKWQLGMTQLPSTVTDSATSLSAYLCLGMAGMSDLYPSASQPAYYQVSGSYPAYYLLRTAKKVGPYQEIVKCTAIGSYGGVFIVQHVQPNGTTTTGTTYRTATMTVTRGQLGSVATAMDVGNGAYVNIAHDITAFVRTSREILKRFAYGCQVIELDTPMAKDWVGVGDFVTVTWPDYVAYGVDGLTSSTQWEVIGKEASPFASPPKISWRLAKVDTYTPTDGILGHFGKGKASKLPGVFAIAEQATARAYVVSGLVGSAVSGLGGKVSAGYASVGDERAGIQSDQSITFEASKDTYVVIDTSSGALVLYDVANGAAVPTKQITEAWVAKFVTNGSAITSVDNSIKETMPHDLDKVKDGSTWKKIGGVDASNKATSSSYGKGSVDLYGSKALDNRTSNTRNSGFVQKKR